MRHPSPTAILVTATLLTAVSFSTTAGEISGGELDPEEGGGTSAAVYHLEMLKTAFEATIATELGNGNKLVDIEVRTVTQTAFSGVFYPVAGTVHTLIHGDQTEWDAFLAMVAPLDGRWLDLEVGFHGTPSRRYSAIFLEDGDDYGYAVDSDMTDAELQTKMETELRAGRQLIDFEAYTIPGSGDTAFAAIWVNDPNQPMTHLYYDLEIDDVDDLWTPLAGRVIDFERYDSSFFGEERFALLVANHPGGEWWADTYMTQAELDATNASVADTDTHLIDLHVFWDGSAIRFSGVWGETWKSLNELAAMPAETIVPPTSVLNTQIANFEAQAPNGALVGFYAKNLRTGQSVGYRKDEPFYLGSATKTAAHIRLWQLFEDGHFDATGGQNSMMAFTNASNSGAPWYMDERPAQGFGTAGYDGNNNLTNNDLGMSFTLDRFDEGMMQQSDNAATTALIDDPTFGLSWDATNLNEWLSSIDGVGQGWGVVTGIQDTDRMIIWQGQHIDALKTLPSYFLAPGHTLRPRLSGTYRACSSNSGTVEPLTCPTPGSCTRCGSAAAHCAAGETCRGLEDPWGDLRAFFGLPSNGFLPACSDEYCSSDGLDKTTGRLRYFNTGINSSTPRAFSNLLEKFWNGDFLADNTAALGNMLGDTPLGSGLIDGNALADALCRYDTNNNGMCNTGAGYERIAYKGGAKGDAGDDTRVCTDTGLIRMTDTDEVFTVVFFSSRGSLGCTALRQTWEPVFGQQMLQSVAVDLVPDGGSFTPTTAGASDEIRFDIMIDNIGGGLSPAFDVAIYASTDMTIDPIDPNNPNDPSDELLGIIPSGGPGSFGGVGVANYPLQLTGQLGPGSYYIGMVVDVSGDPKAGEVPELDETAASNIGLLTTQQLLILPPCPDADADGHADCSGACDPVGVTCGDCDDANPDRYPGNVEICDGVDNDCDTIIDNNIPTPLVARRVEHDDPQANDTFGGALANLGDLDGDGVDDFAVGTPGRNDPAGPTNVGLVRVFSGASLTPICDAGLPSPTGSDNLGASVAAAGGDLDGNGQKDFVVGVPNYDGAGTNTGAVAVFNGPDCAFIRLMEDPAMAAHHNLGHSVASIGDVDNDTVPDIAAASLASDLSGVPGGAISLFSGATGAVLFTMFDPAAEADDLGDALVGPGDLTGDGVPDVAAGAPLTDLPGSSNGGAIYIFSGATGAYVDRYTDPTGESSSRLGESLAAIGDLGADGVSELAAGQNGDQIGGQTVGSVAVFNGATGALILRYVNPIGVNNERFPTALAPIADLSGDGVGDVVVGAEGDDDPATDVGSVFIFNAVTGGLLHHVFDPAGGATDRLGTHVISLGDVSGDGVPDFAAGAPLADNIEGNSAGHVVVFVLEEDCDNDGFAPYAGDCVDSDPSIYPGRFESCDMIDNDCDGLTDEDSDGDGFAICDDCNDLNPLVNPDAIEICNGINDDCDAFTDSIPSLPDLDGDGVWGPCSDCDNMNPDINFNQPDTCNHIDDDCSGLPDEGFPKVTSTRVSMLPSGEADDELATSVAAIGDVNNDGIPDFVAGAPLADNGGSVAGLAAVFDGATGALVCTAAGTQAFAQAGLSVAGVGDVNGDGSADFAMGVPYYDTTTFDNGKVDVINGDDCALIRELVDSNSNQSDHLGLAVAGIGDLTGDGIGEIAGGASWAQTPYGSQAGAVLVWNGATGAELYKLTDPHTGSNYLGSSVAGVDDVNADGVPDIVAGAPRDDGLLGGDVGSVLVFSGADGSIIHKIFDPAGTGSDWLGTSVAGIADLNGDWVPDILAGAPRENSGGLNNGAILVFSGADGTLVQRVPLTDAGSSRFFGTALAVIGDLTGDLLPEFAGGAPNDDTEGTDAGRVLVIDGSDFSVVHDITLPGSSDSSNFGIALAGIADLNGDLEPELLIGHPRQHTQEDADVGRVVVWSYGSDCDSDGVGGLFLEDCDDQDGQRYPGLFEICDGIDNDCDVSIDEDEDGDGDDACADCAPAVPTISTTMVEVCNSIDDNCDLQVDEGVDNDGDSHTTPCDCDDGDPNVNFSIAEVCNTIDDNCDGAIDEGFASPLDRLRVTDPEAQVADDTGASVAVIGDVDSDSVLDFVVGVPGDNAVANRAGSGLVFSGATRSLICRVTHPDAMIADSLGRSAAGVGDVTGDGVPDIALGTRSDDGAGAASGAVQIFDGATCSWVRELKDPGAAANDLFGVSIASIGDVTGDAVPDIAVGSDDDDENGYTNVGSVSVFDGATGAFLYKALDPHGRDNDELGTSVSALGDVDFDGVPDFAAGAPFDNVDPRGSAGSVTLFSGVDGSFIRSISDPLAVANQLTGRSVAAAGDMNGDGVPDLIAGAEGEDSGAINAGAVLAFSGADGALIRRYVDSSPLSSADLGTSVAAVGDLNGDGVTEILAGAPDSTRIGSAAGEAVLFDGAGGAVLYRFTDPSSQAFDDFGISLAAADLNGGGLEVLVGAPEGDPAGLNSAGYATLFTLDADCDGDGFSPLADCDDGNAGTTGAPTPAQGLVFDNKTTLTWTAPADPGLSPGTLAYDVVRSGDPSDFTTAATCVESDDGADTTAVDTGTPGPGGVYGYLVRVETTCGATIELDRPAASCP